MTDARKQEEIQSFDDTTLYQELMDRPYTQALKGEVHRRLRSYDWRSARILEIGAGVSEFLEDFPPDNCVVLTDLTHSLLSQNDPRGHPVVCDAEALPFREGGFDFIYLIGVLHHLPDQARALQETRRVLKGRGGKVLICEPHRRSLNFLYHNARLVIQRLLGVDRVKKMIGCFSPQESQVDVRAVYAAFVGGYQIRRKTFLSVRLPPFRLFSRCALDARLSRILDPLPLFRSVGTTILLEVSSPDPRGALDK